jgi:NitT/TauT family transport system substrate-binding protein
MKRRLVLLCAAALLWPTFASAEVEVIKIPRGAGGVGFLPLLVMEQKGLIEQKARELGVATLKVEWLKLGGPALVNDLLLSGAADIVVAGPPAFLTLWDRARENFRVKGIASMTSIPMYLNTRSPYLKSIRDFGPSDKLAVTAVKVSIPAIILQMAAIKEFGRTEYAALDKYTVSLSHPDALIALLSGGGEITAHFTSPPFHQRERKSPNIRTIMTSNDVMGGPSTFTLLYTTGKFHDANPKVYAAFLKALEEAIAAINADKRAAAQTFLDMEGQGMKLDEVLEVLNDPDIRYTTSPENLMKYAEFMNDVGSIKARPVKWQEMFFPAIHHVPGS